MHSPARPGRARSLQPAGGARYRLGRRLRQARDPGARAAAEHDLPAGDTRRGPRPQRRPARLRRAAADHLCHAVHAERPCRCRRQAGGPPACAPRAAASCPVRQGQWLRLRGPADRFPSWPPKLSPWASPGWVPIREDKRVYPEGTLATQVLGLVGSAARVSAGIEYSENGALSGQPGSETVIADPAGQVLHTLHSTPPYRERTCVSRSTSRSSMRRNTFWQHRVALPCPWRHRDRRGPRDRRDLRHGQRAACDLGRLRHRPPLASNGAVTDVYEPARPSRSDRCGLSCRRHGHARQLLRAAALDPRGRLHHPRRLRRGPPSA